MHSPAHGVVAITRSVIKSSPVESFEARLSTNFVIVLSNCSNVTSVCLVQAEKSRHHGFGGYASFYSPPQSHNGIGHGGEGRGEGRGGGGGGGGGHSGQPQYVATNECRLIDYRGARIAAFLAANRQSEYLLCLPQAFELFLKHLVGGLHTVYTKLKVSNSWVGSCYCLGWLVGWVGRPGCCCFKN